MSANEYIHQRRLYFYVRGQEGTSSHCDLSQQRYVFVRSCEKICTFFFNAGHPKSCPLPPEVVSAVVALLEACDTYILRNFPDAYVDGSKSSESLWEPQKKGRVKK